MAIAASRRLRLIVPGAGGEVVLAVGGDLPAVDVATASGEPTSAAAARWLGRCGLPPWLIDCVVDQIDPDLLGDDVREALIETAPPPAGWLPPTGWTWTRWAELRPVVADGIAIACERRLAEWRGDADVPIERVEWARPGWFEAAREWIIESSAALGLPPPDDVVQVRHWGGSAVMRVELGADRLWFKATIPVFRSEPTITAELARRSAGATGRIVCADRERGWMLLEDLGEVGIDPDVDGREVVDRFVSLQRSLVGQVGELVDAGLEARPLSGLPAQVAAILDTELVARAVGGPIDPTAVAERLRTSVDVVLELGVPDTVVHGDLHPGNVARTERGLVYFDWSDGCVGSPLIEIGAWAAWYATDPARRDRLWEWYRAAWRREFDVDVGAIDRSVVEVVVGAFHAVSYVRIIASQEPSRQGELIDGLEFFLRLLMAP